MEKLNFRQMTLITDGCSNEGLSPVIAAKQAYNQGIIVNVVGITDRTNIEKQAQEEISRIAEAGGGMSQIVPIENVAKTVQMVTRHAMNKTIQQVVHQQLTEILGKDRDVLSIPPMERVRVAQMVDEVAEYSSLEVFLLVDQSASMFKKMQKVQEAIIDFQLSLMSRSGDSMISVATFPSDRGVLQVKIPWTSDLKQVPEVLHGMRASGNTPTGPAILESIHCIKEGNAKKETGVLDEYVI